MHLKYLLVVIAIHIGLQCSLHADDGPSGGRVTFAFDGGTLLCTFGQSDESKAAAVMIVHPYTVKRRIDRESFVPRVGTPGSVVMVVKPGMDEQLRRDELPAWARARIEEMGSRESSVAEHAFVAAVVHTITTGQPLRLWGARAQQALEAGKWSQLFSAAKNSSGSTGNADPFGDNDPTDE